MKIFEFNRWQPYQFEALQAHLEKRAARGWLLERIDRDFLVYRRGEPGERHYELAYHPRGPGQFDPEPTEALLIYRDYCRQAGWELVGPWGTFPQIEVYASSRPDPVPIQSDDSVRWSVLADWMELRYIPMVQLSAALIGLSIGLFALLFLAILPFSLFFRYFSDLAVCACVLCVLLVMEVALRLNFCRKWLAGARQAAEGEGREPNCREPVSLRLIHGLFVALILVLFLLEYLSGGAAGVGNLLLFLAAYVAVVWGTDRLREWLRRRGTPGWITFGIDSVLLFGLIYILQKLL